MAIQSARPSSSSTSGTGTQSTSTSTATAGHASGQNGAFFSPAGSPPLVLAFLAIGLFAAGMIAVFGWRRIRFGRAWATADAVGGAAATRRKQYHDIGEKPKLWDLWIEMNHTTANNMNGLGEAKWENIMPVSAVTILDEPALDTDKPIPEFHHPPVPPMALPRLPLDVSLHFGRHRYLRHRPLASQDIDIDAHTTNADSEKVNEAQSHMEVAVAIAMPNPSPSRHLHDNPNDERPLEYAIGVIEFPWRPKEG